VISTIVGWVTGGLVDKVLEVYRLHKQGKISEAEFEAKVKIAAQETAAKVEESWAEASASIARATQATLKSSPLLQRAWAVTIFLQLVVLVWYQLGAPAYLVITGTAWPSPGTTVEWAYLLLGAMLGAGPLVFRR
jgi:exo-beta-1,3-glucanase (GH17 family)